MNSKIRQKGILDTTESYIRQTFEKEGSGHDWWHIFRVWKLATELQKTEGGDLFIIEMAALLHDLDALTNSIKKIGVKTHIETSGSSPLSGNFDWITLSPKRFKKPLDEVFPYVDELKVVVLKNKDLEWAEKNAEKCPEGTQLLLQPEWETPESVKLIIEYVKKNPQWGISLQTHKFMNVP